MDEIAQELYEQHGERYDFRQLQLWARMKLNGQHNSMEHPPAIPLFTGAMARPARKDSLSDALTSAATAVAGILKGKTTENGGNSMVSPGGSGGSTMSPGKRAHVSGQYLDHLEKLKKLQDSGVLSTSEFEEQKEFALTNIKQLNN